MMFAEWLPNPTLQQMALWLACLAAFFGAGFLAVKMANAVMEFRDRVSGRHHAHAAPQPFEVKEYSGVATERECKERHQSALEELQAVKAGITEDRESSLASRNRIYDEIRKVQGMMESKLESVRKELGGHTENVRVELSEQIGNLPDRMFALLRNAGVIKDK